MKNSKVIVWKWLQYRNLALLRKNYSVLLTRKQNANIETNFHATMLILREKIVTGLGFESGYPALCADTLPINPLDGTWAKQECFLLLDPLYFWIITIHLLYGGEYLAGITLK